MEFNNTQLFEKPITQIIKERTSIRSYNSQPLDSTVADKVIHLLNESKGPFDIDTRFNLVNANLDHIDSNLKLGTYGVIKGTSWFIASAVKNTSTSLIELGYKLEKGILYATSLGLGTCWLGGTFKKGEFAKVMNLKEDEILPIITPIGYSSESRRLMDSFIRLTAGSKNRKPWSEMFFNNNFSKPLTEALAEEYSIPLEMLRLAPSASNKQPWRIVKNGDTYDFYLEHTKGYGKAFSYDIQMVDMGIALCHFELTSIELGLAGNWQQLKTNIKELPPSTEYVISWVKK
ncbi:MAG: nitroreductase family protein [Clostridiaceae bacterium]|nr:nitroreductase family protein [Clostridiaceae bacterium]